jgi:hypothetical protein
VPTEQLGERIAGLRLISVTVVVQCSQFRRIPSRGFWQGGRRCGDRPLPWLVGNDVRADHALEDLAEPGVGRLERAELLEQVLDGPSLPQERFPGIRDIQRRYRENAPARVISGNEEIRAR